MNELLDIVNEMSPYLLAGFLVAGIMHAFVPSWVYGRYLAQPGFRSVLYAALAGVPLPLCSCGVIPAAMSLRREGASRGATTSFLIATPQTGVDSIFATYSLMGLPFALLRPIAAFCTALLGGQLVNWLVKETPAGGKAAAPRAADNRRPTLAGRLADALLFGFVDMVADIGKWLVAGLLVAALITLCVPAGFFSLFAGNSLLSMLVVLCVAIPMYVCATGSIPIAVALMLKGLTPGAALVLLMAGPASNVASILVVNKVMGRRTLLIYLASITAGAILFGLGVDYLLPREWFTSSLTAGESCCNAEASWFQWTCSGLLTALLCYALLLRPALKKRDARVNPSPSAMNEQLYHIEGMSCNHCRLSAEKALQSVDGVLSATVDLTTREARVRGDAPREALAKALEESGFKLTD